MLLNAPNHPILFRLRQIRAGRQAESLFEQAVGDAVVWGMGIVGVAGHIAGSRVKVVSQRVERPRGMSGMTDRIASIPAGKSEPAGMPAFLIRQHSAAGAGRGS